MTSELISDGKQVYSDPKTFSVNKTKKSNKAESEGTETPPYKKIKLIHHPYSAASAAQQQLPSQYTGFATQLSPDQPKAKGL
jgi:hypothetical protein